MISEKAFGAYAKATNALAKSASDKVETGILNLVERLGTNNIAAIREGSKTVMSAVIQEYSDAAASLAAQFYDTQSTNSGCKLPVAITETVFSNEMADKTARYQARKLKKGDIEGFAKSCGELALNDVKQSLNATILANCKRDESKGVRFARVLTGFESCTFCIMLAGRGAVYHSRKTAGELNHYHRRCDCKIVPDFDGGDPMRTIVKGHDPWVEYRTWKRIKNAEVVASDLYQSTPSQIQETVEKLDRELKTKWKEQKIIGDYQGVFGTYLAEHGVAAEDLARPLGKELQVGQWLAEQGFEVQFLRADGNSRTPDILLNGEQWEIKRIETSRAGVVRRRINDALGQSSNIIIDLSINSNSKDLLIPAIKMLEDGRIEKLLIIDNGELTLYKRSAE